MTARLRRKRLVRRVLIVLAVVLALVSIGGGIGLAWLTSSISASLPRLDGRIVVVGLTSEVTVERDDLGVPTVRAANALDLVRAVGFLHAQDRFFQMDLLRRRAAGELAELFGPAALSADRSARVHRFRARAGRIVDTAPVETRELLAAYAAGVNAGLGDLGAAPPEYLLLRNEPVAWRPEDTILVYHAFYLTLQSGSWTREKTLGLMHDLLPEELFEFLVPAGDSWDAPIVGGPLEGAAPPGPDTFDLRREPRSEARLDSPSPIARAPVPGSNSWAVAGRRTGHGGALVANDMHLPLGMPATWYRMRLEWTDENGEAQQTVGVTTPGVPHVVAGSNGRVAWGLTNSQGDWLDLVLLEPDPENDGRYRTADGPREFEIYEERIGVRGGEEVVVEVRETIWGPVVDEDHLGRERALRWVAHDDVAANAGIVGLALSTNVEEALEAAARTGLPAQNLVAGDQAGNVGWTVAGPIPGRFGFDGRLPTSWAEGTRGWDGWLSPAEYPRVVDAASGLVWTANNRVVGGPMLKRIGDGGWAPGPRARQIRDALLRLERAVELDMLAIQLDDRALFHERWRELLLELLASRTPADDEWRIEFRRLIEDDWSGTASVDSAGYRLVRAYRLFLSELVFDPLTARCRAVDDEFRYTSLGRFEGPLWTLITERPPHLLDPRYADWNDLLMAAVEATRDYFEQESDAPPLDRRTWGERNQVLIEHPLSRALPWIGEWTDLPVMSLPGDSNMPRVQGPRFGASERFAVSPGREERGYFHMPGGQSGHPRSPYYSKGYESWAAGDPAPFLPGPAVHRLTLAP